MNAKHSAILLSGLLLLMIGIALAQSSSNAAPTCPPLSDEFLQGMLQPTAWARADWNAKTSRWEIDCDQIDAIANMAVGLPANANMPANAISNAANTPANATPSRRRRGSNLNSNYNSYVNTDPYKAPPDTNTYVNGMPYPGANMVPNALPVNAATNAVNAPARRTPTRRRPSD